MGLHVSFWVAGRSFVAMVAFVSCRVSDGGRVEADWLLSFSCSTHRGFSRNGSGRGELEPLEHSSWGGDP